MVRAVAGFVINGATPSVLLKYHCFRCQFCPKLNLFLSQEVCKEHEEYWHRVVCQVEGCSFSCQAEWRLQNHQFREHRMPKPDHRVWQPDRKEQTCCEVCGKQFANKKNLVYHMEAHGDTKISCSLCDKVFKRDSNLRLHMKTMHSDQTFICETCSETFKNMRTLRLHRQYYHMERKYKCQLCPKTFVNAPQLKQHMTNVHIRDTPHKCKYCGKAYNDMSNMRQHERRQHEGDLTYGRSGKRGGRLKSACYSKLEMQ